MAQKNDKFKEMEIINKLVDLIYNSNPKENIIELSITLEEFINYYYGKRDKTM